MKNKKPAIKPERLSEHDKKVINGYFTWLDREDKEKIAKKFNVTVTYVNMVIAGTRFHKNIFSYALGQAMKKKQAHLKTIRELKQA